MAGPGKPGPAKIEIDPAKLEKLPDWVFTRGALAVHLGIHHNTLNARCDESEELSETVKDALARQKSRADSWSSKLLMEKVKTGDMTAHIWFDKSRLGYSDRQTNIHEGELSVEYVNDWRGKPKDPE